MSKKVLIISLENDYHALIIQARLKKFGAGADIIDTTRIPTEFPIRYKNNRHETEICLGDLKLSDYHSVWWRRAGAPKISGDITDAMEARFAARECSEGLWGCFAAAGIPIYNQPEFERIACYKPLQLKLARDCGLLVPDTLMTTAPEAVREFRGKHEQVVYKALSATTIMMTDTRPLAESDLQTLDGVKYAPVIFQEYIPLAREYRVALIEDEIFAVEINIQNPKAHYDWRLDHNYRIAKATLPPDIITKLQDLRRRLRLSTGSVDLRETPDGKIYFLEINPSGQFLFLDVFAGCDVAGGFCRMLLQ